MSAKTEPPTQNGAIPEPHSISPTAVIQKLMARIADLTMECAMKDAYIEELEQRKSE